MYRSACLATAFFLLVLTGCRQEAPESVPPAPPEVEVRTIEQELRPVVERFPGKTQAVTEIQLKAEVSSPITAIHFREGQEVSRGDLLIELDAQPFIAAREEQLRLLEASQSAVSIADTRYGMAMQMAESGGMSRLEIESIRVDLATARANQASAEAALANAELDLEATRMTAPRSGIAGLSKAEVGEFVTPLSGPLVTVLVDRQIEVLTEITASKYLEYMARLRDQPGLKPDILTLELPDGSVYPHEGVLDYVSREISEATGTVTHRVVFPNEEGILVAGQSVTLVSTEVDPVSMVVVPQAAVQEDQMGRYVFTVDADSIAQKRYLTMGDRTGTDWIVEKGLNAGDRYVARGILRVKQGQPVKPIQQ